MRAFLILTVAFVFLAGFSIPAGAASPSTSQLKSVRNTFYFEPNRGQVAGPAHYIGYGSDVLVYLAPRAISWSVGRAGKGEPGLLRLSFPGSNTMSTIQAESPLPGRSHYYRGSDPRGWLRDIPMSSRIRYRALYPGIDLLIYGNGGKLEYDFLVSPGGDPDLIRLNFEGYDALHIDGHGNLVVEMQGADQVHQRPFAYQVVEGEQHPVAVTYVLHEDQVALKIAGYNQNLPLIIDPVVTYSRYLGGGDADAALSVASDGSGGLYVTGHTRSIDFPGMSGSSVSGFDVFVTRIDANGTIVYTAVLGSDDVTTAGDSGRSIRVDDAGNAYVVGVAEFSNFPVTSGALDTSYNGFPSDAFVSVLDPSGSLIYSSFIGGGSADEAFDVAVDNAGDIYVTGFTRSSDFPVKAAYLDTYGGVMDAFILKLRPGGNGVSDLIYSSYFGGGGGDLGRAIALGTNGRAYIAGETNSLAGIASGGAYQGMGDGFQDGFVAYFDLAASGAASFLAGTYLGGAGDQDSIQTIAIGSSGEVYVAGNTLSGVFPLTADALDTEFRGGSEAFVSISSSMLDALSFSSFLGGGGQEDIRGIVVDAGQQIYLVGWTDSSDFPGTAVNLPAYPYGGGKDAFVSKIDDKLTLAYSLYLGGTDADEGYAIDHDDQYMLYVVGETRSPDMLTVQAANGGEMISGGADAFLFRLEQRADLGVTASLSGAVREGEVFEYSVTVSNKGPDVADEIMLESAALDNGLDYQSSSWPNCAYDAGTRIISCAVGSLGAGESIVLNIAVVHLSPLPVTATFSVSGRQGDDDLSNNSIQVTSVVDDSQAPTIIVTDPLENTSGGGGGGVFISVWALLILIGRRSL